TWLHAKNDDERAAVQAELQEQLGRRKDRLDGASVDDAVAMLKSRDTVHAQRAAGAVVLKSADADAYNAALAAARKDDNTAAFAAIKPAADKPDAAAAVLNLACWIAAADGVVALDGKARCERAMKASPSDLGPLVGALRFASKAGDA